MKSSFVVASLVALSTLATAENVEETHRIEVSVEVTATRVTARNHGDRQQILLFRSGEHGPVFARSLPPAGELDYAFPRHALAGVQIEVVTVHGAGAAYGMANSGAVALGDAFAGGTDTAWFQTTPEGSFVWLERNGDFTPHRPDDTLVPRRVLERGPKFEDFLQPNNASGTHVPVVTPRDKPDEYGPPELEDQPLPPV